jgi:hypothetical protein
MFQLRETAAQNDDIRVEDVHHMGQAPRQARCVARERIAAC